MGCYDIFGQYLCLGNDKYELKNIPIDQIDYTFINQNKVFEESIKNNYDCFYNNDNIFEIILIKILYYKKLYLNTVNNNSSKNNNNNDIFIKFYENIMNNIDKIQENFNNSEFISLKNSKIKIKSFIINEKVIDKILWENCKMRIIDNINNYEDIIKFITLISYFNFCNTNKTYNTIDDINRLVYKDIIRTFDIHFLRKKIRNFDSRSGKEYEKIYYALMKYYYNNNIHPLCHRFIKRCGYFSNNKFVLVFDENNTLKVKKYKSVDYNHILIVFSTKLNKVRNYIRPNDTIEDILINNNFNYYKNRGKYIFDDLDVLYNINNLSISIERDNDNFNVNTFDFVRVYFSFLPYNKENLKKLQDNKNNILNFVVKFIENNYNYRKFNIPVNFLKLTNMIYREDGILEFLFELKIF